VSYILNLAEPLNQAVPSIASEQLDAALARLTSADQDESAIHAARRHFKRTRALLELVKRVDKGPATRNAHKLLSSAGKMLSESRDAQVAVDAAETLRQDFADGSNDRLFDDLESWLRERHRQAQQQAASETIRNAIEEIAKAKASLSTLDFGDAAVKDLLASASHTYKRGRRAMKTALASEDSEDIHEWRKQAQRHWRQTALLKMAWPKDADARAKLAKKLSDALGLHHDLAVLRDMIMENRAVFRSPADVKALCSFIERKQDDILKDAEKRGERLYAEKPKAFHARLAAYWKSAAHLRQARRAARGQKCTKEPPCGPGCKCEKKRAAKSDRKALLRETPETAI